MQDPNKHTSLESDLIIRERLRSLESKIVKLRRELGIVVAALVYCLYLVVQHTSLFGVGLRAGQMQTDSLALGGEGTMPRASISSRLLSMETADGKLQLAPNSSFLRIESPGGVIVDFALNKGNVIISRTDEAGLTTEYNLTRIENVEDVGISR